MSIQDEVWKDEVRQKLGEVFRENAEDFVRILHFLDEEDKAYKDEPRPYAPQWKSLKATLNSDNAFKLLAKRLADDTKKAEKDQKFRATMNMIYEQMINHEDENVDEDEYQGFNTRLENLDVGSKAALGGLAKAWDTVPLEYRASVLRFVTAVARNQSVSTMADDVVSLANKTGGTVVMVGLAAVHIAYEAYVSIKRWWKGEITGKRCVKNIIDSTNAALAGVVGGSAGVAAGSFFGPVGALIGGIMGGLISAEVAKRLSDLLIQKLFGLPKEEALENAYVHLGVKMTASNAEINTAFRKLCLKYHPDKPGGSKEKFYILQCHMTVIKQAREGF